MSRVDTVIAIRKPADYDAAVTLLTDLQALAEREDRHHMFTLRAPRCGSRTPANRALVERLDRAGI